jgi:hypothetical protein
VAINTAGQAPDSRWDEVGRSEVSLFSAYLYLFIYLFFFVPCFFVQFCASETHKCNIFQFCFPHQLLFTPVLERTGNTPLPDEAQPLIGRNKSPAGKRLDDSRDRLEITRERSTSQHGKVPFTTAVMVWRRFRKNGFMRQRCPFTTAITVWQRYRNNGFMW